jgi:predicted acylesterase/phospholipase RssA
MNHLVLGPGSMGFFSMLGVLQVLENTGKLSNVHEISGCSAGSIIGLLLSIDNPYTVRDILDTTLSIDVPLYTQMNLSSFFNTFGFISHTPIKELLIRLCHDTNPTFKDLSKKLTVSACCVTTQKTEYFSVDTHPTMYVIDAICMSISIPLLFSTYTYDNKSYIDGGTLEKVPLSPFLHKHPRDIIVVYIHMVKTIKSDISTLKNFMTACVDLYMSNMEDPPLFCDCERYAIDSNIFDFHNFELDYDTKLKMFMHGQQIALEKVGVTK